MSIIKIYTSPSCSSCRKVKQWFEEQEIPYLERNIFTSVLSDGELKDILGKTENGTEDIISTRSKVLRDNRIDINELNITDLINFIKKYPSILKRPIIVDDHKIQVGYNAEEIRSFIPAEKRMAERAANPFFGTYTDESSLDDDDDYDGYGDIDYDEDDE